MAFGDSPVLLSSFTGTDEDPLSESGNWATSSANALQRLSNQASGRAAVYSSSYWTVTTYPANAIVEAYGTWATIGAATEENEIRFATTASHPTGPIDGYEVYTSIRTGAANDRMRLYRIDDDAFTILTTVATRDFSSGEKIGFQLNAITGDLTGYYNSGSGWVSHATANDGTYTGPWNVELWIQNATSKWDDLYAGSVATASRLGMTLLGVGI